LSETLIVGAGLSGMVAAIHLARQGEQVRILEKELCIGGSPGVHPSLHATPIDIRHTADFIGIDLSGHFRLLTDFHTWILDRRLYPSLINYGVERGPRESSIDSYLYGLCLALGVRFEFGHAVHALADLPPGSIAATGLTAPFRDLSPGRAVPVKGYWFRMPSQLGPASWQYGDLYSSDYFYAVAMNGLLYGLVFGRREDLDPAGLRVIERQLQEREGIAVDAWHPFSCQVMLGTRLFCGPEDRYIAAGTASGSVDPFFGFGIVGALTTGKIAALAVRDPHGARALFDRVNRHHGYLYWLFELLSRVPRSLKWKVFARMAIAYPLLKPLLGPIGLGIPGYPRDWIAEFITDRGG